MRRIFISVVMLFLLLFACRAEEILTIATYYPSPYGSYNELQTNKLAVGDTNGNGSLDAADQPPRQGQLQVGRGVIFTPQDFLPGSDVREGEVVYDSAPRLLRYYNGSEWKAVGGSCYTQYCYQSSNYGTPVCPATVMMDAQGPCDSGFFVRKSLGAWGYCGNNDHSYFLPPGGTCGPLHASYTDGLTHRVGQAYLCCQ